MGEIATRAATSTARCAATRGDGRHRGDGAPSPDNPQRLFDHAQNVFWVGDIARQRGQMARAETALREYKRLADRMVAIDPDNLKWRMETQYAAANLGIALFEQRRFPEASRQFQEALNTIEQLAAAEPRQQRLSEVRRRIARLAGGFRSAPRAVSTKRSGSASGSWHCSIA